MSNGTVAPIFARGTAMDFSKAIPSKYRGVDFRSRFEANTAFFLDVLGLTWKYEPISFLLPNGSHYRPDFLVPELNLWLECRGYRSEEGDRQIRAFGRMIRYGEIDPSGGNRPPSAWNEEELTWAPYYLEREMPDFAVLLSGEHDEWWEYVGRRASSADPTGSEVNLHLCSRCSRWFFSAGGYVVQCRHCLRVWLWSELALTSVISVEGSTVKLWDVPLPENGILPVAEWARKHELIAPEAPSL